MLHDDAFEGLMRVAVLSCAGEVSRLRCVGATWKRTVDGLGPSVLASETGLSQRAVSLMLQWLGGGSSVPWVRALSWWRCVCKIVQRPGLTVAGSAALFVEHLLASRDPGFAPADIDVWRDTSIVSTSQATAWLSTLTTLSDRFRYHGQHFSLALWGEADNLIEVTARHDIRIQIISSAQGDPAPVCRCEAEREGCPCCLSPMIYGGRPGRLGMLSEYSRWPTGLPHRRFDLDVACVALRVSNGGLVVHRLRGDPSRRTMRLLAPGLWRIDPHDLDAEPAERNVLQKRLAKYRSRGYTQIQVEASMTIHDGFGGTKQVATPPWLLEDCRAFNELRG